MNISPIKAIYNFNKKAGLLERGYNEELESSLAIEESLENATNLDELARVVGSPNPCPKEISRAIASIAKFSERTESTVDRIDKHVDNIVINFGSLFKLGLSPQEAMSALSIVMEANLAKLKNIEIDSHGKLSKPENFVSPEEKLKKFIK